MILSRRLAADIERHFTHASDDYDELERLKLEIAEASRPMDPSGVRGGGPGDPTGRAVVEIERRCADIENWIRVVLATYTHFAGQTAGDFMNLYYVQGKTLRVVCKELFISRASFYGHRENVLTYAAIKGAEFNLISLEV